LDGHLLEAVMSVQIDWRGEYPSDVPTAISRAESDVLARYAAGKDVLEVGAWHGYSTIVMARVAKWVCSVDWHRGDAHAGAGDTLESFMNNLARYGVVHKVDVRVGRIENVAQALELDGYDVGFLDAFHTEDAVLRHLMLMSPLIKVGGFMLAHDYGRESGGLEQPDRFGVHRGVAIWLLAKRSEWESVELVDTVFVARRIA